MKTRPGFPHASGRREYLFIFMIRKHDVLGCLARGSFVHVARLYLNVAHDFCLVTAPALSIIMIIVSINIAIIIIFVIRVKIKMIMIIIIVIK